MARHLRDLITLLPPADGITWSDGIMWSDRIMWWVTGLRDYDVLGIWRKFRNGPVKAACVLNLGFLLLGLDGHLIFWLWYLLTPSFVNSCRYCIICNILYWLLNECDIFYWCKFLAISLKGGSGNHRFVLWLYWRWPLHLYSWYLLSFCILHQSLSFNLERVLPILISFE